MFVKIQKLKKMILMDKSIIEKIRIFYFRIRKKYYISKTSRISIQTHYGKFPERNFFYETKQIEIYSREYKDEVVKEANKIIDNIYRTISGDSLKIEKNMNWNKDYIFNFEWRNQHYAKYKLKDPNVNQDVKHVWELSRFYHVVILAQAYIITKQEKYALKIIEDILSWEEQNPFNNSINWTVSMEVAIRVVNVIESISLIRQSKVFNDDISIKINNFIYKHGVYIINNLEKGFNTNNHYLANLIGLIWIGVFFQEAEDTNLGSIGKKYLSFSIKQLLIELNYQVYDDGFCYEDSIAYHGLNTEMLLLTLKILERNRIDYPAALKEYAVKMINALRRVVINDKIPLFGDLDNGKLLICDIKSLTDKTYFSYLFKIAEDMGIVDSKVEIVSPIQFQQSGFYRLFNSKYDIIVRCGKIGLNGIGAHAHNDQLSFVLHINNEQIFVDPGTGYYSGDYKLRRMLRSTSSHNTLDIEGYEQNNIDIDLFKMVERTKSVVEEVTRDYFRGKHFGFFDELGIVFEREIMINDKIICILDKIDKFCPNEQKYNINFILDTDIFVEKIDSNRVVITKGTVKVELYCENGDISIGNQLLSKSYASVETTKKLVISMKNKYVKTFIKFIE